MRKYSCQPKTGYSLSILKTRVIEILTKFLKKEFSSWEKLQVEVLWLICNVLTLDSNILELYIKPDEIIPILISFIDFKNQENCQQVLNKFIFFHNFNKNFYKDSLGSYKLGP